MDSSCRQLPLMTHIYMSLAQLSVPSLGSVSPLEPPVSDRLEMHIWWIASSLQVLCRDENSLRKQAHGSVFSDPDEDFTPNAKLSYFCSRFKTVLWLCYFCPLQCTAVGRSVHYVNELYMIVPRLNIIPRCRHSLFLSGLWVKCILLYDTALRAGMGKLCHLKIRT